MIEKTKKFVEFILEKTNQQELKINQISDKWIMLKAIDNSFSVHIRKNDGTIIKQIKDDEKLTTITYKERISINLIRYLEYIKVGWDFNNKFHITYKIYRDKNNLNKKKS